VFIDLQETSDARRQRLL